MEHIHLQAAKFRCRLYSMVRQLEVQEVKDKSQVTSTAHLHPENNQCQTQSLATSNKRAAYVVHNNLLISENKELKTKLDAAVQSSAQHEAVAIRVKEEQQQLANRADRQMKQCDEKVRDHALFDQYLESVKNESLILKETVSRLNSAFVANKSELSKALAERDELVVVLQEHISDIDTLKKIIDDNAGREGELLVKLTQEVATRQQAVTDKSTWELRGSESKGRVVRLQECVDVLSQQLRAEQSESRRAGVLAQEAEVRARMASESLQRSTQAMEDMANRYEASAKMCPADDAPATVPVPVPAPVPAPGFVAASLLYGKEEAPSVAEPATTAPSSITSGKSGANSAHDRMVRVLRALEHDNCGSNGSSVAVVEGEDTISSSAVGRAEEPKRAKTCMSASASASIPKVASSGVCLVCSDEAYGLMVLCRGCRCVEAHSACVSTLIPGFRVGDSFTCPTCARSTGTSTSTSTSVGASPPTTLLVACTNTLSSLFQ